MDSGSGRVVPELVTLAQANAAVAVLVVLGLLAAPVAAFLARRRDGDPLLTGLMVGGPPILVGLMWLVYNAVTDRLGLDRLWNLGVNFALFVTVGGACGAGWVWLVARRAPMTTDAGGDDDEEGPPFIGAMAGGPKPSRGPGTAQTFDEATEPPRNP